MGDGVFQVTLIAHLIGTDLDAVIGVEAAGLSLRASSAVDVVAGDVAA